MNDRQYQVITQVPRSERNEPTDINKIYVRNNKGENKSNKFTSFLLIQQVTKQGEFVGSNKLKHMTDAMLEMRRESERDGGGTFMAFSKNRNGNANNKLSYTLSNNRIEYGMIVNA
jgi:hypothetical protein